MVVVARMTEGFEAAQGHTDWAEVLPIDGLAAAGTAVVVTAAVA